MSAPVRLALLRHGRTAWNRAGRIQGRTDIPLDPEAEAELSALHPSAPWDKADLVSSPLQRAVHTGEQVCRRTPRKVAELLEMDWGDWEGQHGKILRADPKSGYRDIEDWGWDYRPPGGESPADLRDRLLPWMDSLKRDTLAIAHIGVMRVALAVATGWDFAGPCPFAVKRNRLYILEKTPQGWAFDGQPVRLKARGS